MGEETDGPNRARTHLVDELLVEQMAALRRRIRAIKGSGSEWSLNTSELFSTAARRVLASGSLRNTVDSREGLFRLMDRIVRNAVIDRLRRLRRERRARAIVANAEAGAHRWEDPSAEARSLLDALTPDERELVALRLSGDAWGKVAAKMGSTEPAVRQRWCAARRKLFDASES